MKKLVLLQIFLMIFIGVYAQTPKYELDLRKPESVLNAIFYAAQTKDFAILQCLGDPWQESDNDVKQICSMSYIAKQISEYGGNENLKALLNEFVITFETGRISGQIIFEIEDGIEYANVPFWISHPGGATRSDESMQLVKRYGNWYLYSF